MLAFPVLEELSNELMPVNTRRVLRGGGAKRKDPSELDISEGKVKHREKEQGRRATIRDLLHRISAFFLVKRGKNVTGGEVVLFGKSITLNSESSVCLPNHSSYHLSEDR